VSAAPLVPNQQLILDQWSYLAHKTIVGDGTNTISSNLLASWVPTADQRRLRAYLVLDGYRKNRATEFIDYGRLGAEDAMLAKRKHREYGDPSLIQSRIAHGVLGDDWELVVDGADDDLSDGPDLPDPPEDPGEGATPGQREVFALLKARHAEDEKAAIDGWKERFVSQPILGSRQDDLREWGDREGLAAKLVEREDDATALGDALLALAPRGQGEWPELLIYEPDAYFPILGDRPGDGVTKLHMAWEFCDESSGKPIPKVRRLTWELVSFDLVNPSTDEVVGAGGTMPVPWSDEPATRTCLFSEGVWSLDAVGPNGIPDLSDAAAEWATDDQGELRNRDLRCDFIPVYHTPNTPASRTHFGVSCLAVIAQVLDDLGAADTDLMETARLVAGPAIALSGATSNDSTPIAPLTIFNLGADGQMTVLDLSQGLTTMMEFRDGLRDRALVNGHVTKTLVGWTASDSAPSGIALLIDAAPFAQLIGTLRMTREPTDRAMFEGVQKLGMLAGVVEPGHVAPARIAYGNFLPLDRSQVVTEVTALFTAKLITRITAIQLLMAAGFGIEDARREADEIAREDVEAAKVVADATGSEQAAADRLGITLPEKPKPPEITLPPPPNQPPEPPTPGGP
jgi:hypothetical protein